MHKFIPEQISRTEVPKVDWCVTCDKALGSAMEPASEIGPYNHLTFYPKHYIISVEGTLYIWRNWEKDRWIDL